MTAAPVEVGYINRRLNVRCGPQPRQELAHASTADVLLYGGAAFGGKSEYQCVDAIGVALRYPGSNQAIFRRTHRELKQHIAGRLLELVPKSLGAYNGTDMVWRFTNGSTIWLCHAIHESSVYIYQSAEWLCLRIDEAAHFTEFQVRYLMTRVRTSTPGWRPRVRLTSNPGSVGHGWLKRMFVRPEPAILGDRPLPAPGEVWTPLPTHDDPEPLSRCFLPAYAHDNPAGMEADPQYLSRIRQLGGDKARQLEFGDWDANDSMIVGASWRASRRVEATDRALLDLGLAEGDIIPWHVLPDAGWRPAPTANVFGSVDYGYGAPWAFHLHAALLDGHTRTFHERYQARLRDRDQAQLILADCQRLGVKPEWIVIEPVMQGSRAEVGLAKSIREVYDEILAPAGIRTRMGAGGRPARVSRPQRWLDALAVAPDGLPWWSVTTACPNLIRTVPDVPWDEDDPEVEDEDSENHCYEGVGRFFEARPHRPRAQALDQLSALKRDPLSYAEAQRRLRIRPVPSDRPPRPVDGRHFGL